MVGRTRPSAHASNANVTLAVPRPASSGTRTGSWNWLPQQNPDSVYVARTGG